MCWTTPTAAAAVGEVGFVMSDGVDEEGGGGDDDDVVDCGGG